MSVRCPKCKKEYDVTLFEFGREVVCDCGEKLGLKHEEILDPLDEILRQYHLKLEEDMLAQIKKAQDEIVFHIISNEYAQIDIEIEKEKFKELITKLFPDKSHLYELIFEPRFKRLWEQFRQ